MIRWTTDREKRLRDLWAAGHSGSVIARRLGGFDHCTDGGRSAVIGKANRLGLPPRETSTRTPHPLRKRLLSIKARGARPDASSYPKRIDLVNALFKADGYVSPAEEVYIPPSERKTVATLTESSCRWPIGDPQHPEFHFCGKRKIPGLPYCEVHARRAFQPPQARRRELRELRVVAEKETVAT
jgi:GcrA cell cycle regulator